MPKIVRHRMVQIHVEGEELNIRLKKWSAAKLFALTREFWALIEEGLSQVEDFAKLSEIQLIQIVIEKLLSVETKAAKLIEASVDDPKNLATNAILEWDADDFVKLLNEVIEMNITEELVKNFQKLLKNFIEKRPRSSKKTAETVSSPRPVASSA